MPALLLRILWRGRTARAHWHGWWERIGFYADERHAKKLLWVHAVSVGESTAAVPLIRAMKVRFPDHEIVVTTTTLTGAQTVARLLGDSVTHVYFPYDLPWIVRRFLRHYPARMLVILETELWPNTIALCRQRQVPVVLANARLSERSLSAYLRVPALSRWMATNLAHIAAQSEIDAARFRRLGARPAQVDVLGSLKFDSDLPASLHEQAEALRRELGVNRPVLMLGSTREGEEKVLLDGVTRLAESYPDLLTVLAPRHPERFEDVYETCAQAGFKIARRSTGDACESQTEIYLLDSMGELPRFYAAADIAFVGGSLMPYGGHNVLEPAALGTPVVSGPHTYNFTEICQLLAADGVLEVVTDATGFAEVVGRWLADSNERDRLGRVGRELVQAHRGASARTLALIASLLEAPPEVTG